MLPQAAFLLEQRTQKQHWHLGTRGAGRTSHTLHDHNGKKKNTTVLAFVLFVHIFLVTDATYPEIP